MSKATVVLGTLATAIGLTGAVIGTVALAKVESLTGTVPSTVTVAATRESAAVSDSDVHAAAVETCVAVDTFRAGVGAVRQPYVDATKSSSDWNSPEFIALEGRYFGGVAAELAYLRSHESSRTPQGIADTVDELHRSATDLLDADVRRQPGDVANRALAKLRATYDAVTAACDAEGASK